jgi:cell division protein FtsB
MDTDEQILKDVIAKLVAGPSGQVFSDADVRALVALIEARNQKIAHLEKKTAVLNQHNMELTEELENTRRDFGGFR